MDTLVITGKNVSGSYVEFEHTVLCNTSFDRYDQVAVYESNPVIFEYARKMADKHKKNLLVLKSADDENLLANNPSTGFISIGCL